MMHIIQEIQKLSLEDKIELRDNLDALIRKDKDDAVIVGNLTIPVVALIALLSLMSVPFGQLLILLREGFIKLVNKLMEVWRI